MIPKVVRAERSKRSMMWRRLAWSTALVGLVSLAACPRPTDGNPQIAISPNFEARCRAMPALCGLEPTAAAARNPAARARAHPLAAGEQLGGPNATGKVGDWILANDEVVFVIDALGSGGGFAESGGNLVDAADARARKDELGQLFTHFGTFPRQAVYGSIDAAEDAQGAAAITARGRELLDPALAVETTYSLGPAVRALLLTTTITNGGTAPVTFPSLGDVIQWGGAEKVAPDRGVGFKGPSNGTFLGGVGRFVSYGLTTPEGEIAAINGGAWSDTLQAKNTTVQPGASVTYARVFVVGERPDVASIITELTKASEGELGAIEIALVDAAGQPVRAAVGAKAVLATAAGVEVMTLVATKDDLSFGGELPPGRWLVSYAPSVGRRATTGTSSAVEVKKGATAKATLAVTAVAKLDASCAEKDAAGSEAPVPCKITIEGTDGTPTPSLGPTHVSGPARNQLIANLGDVPLAPGKYRLTSTRGPEYQAESAEITLAAGATATYRAVLRRVVDTSGYVAADFHQHSILSADAPVSTRDRVLANAAEAVEVAVASEHNLVADLLPIVRELGMSRYVVSLAGNELTTDASQKPWGHANVYPLLADASRPRGGATAVRDRTAKDVLDEVRAAPGPKRVVQINHPRSGANGYFDCLAFDARTGVGAGAGYDAAFDAIEVWNGRNVEVRAKVLEDFLALLRTSHPVTAIAATDTHGIVGEEPGFPRTYVRVVKDDALDAWDAARTDDLVRSVRERRDVVLTNGPFLQVTANGAGIGGVAAAKGGAVDVRVRVTTAAFAEVDRVELRLAGSGKVVGAASLALRPKKELSGALTAAATFAVRASADDAFVVIVSGPRPMRPMFAGEDKELTPWAMSGAIWIDANGDGKSLGR